MSAPPRPARRIVCVLGSVVTSNSIFVAPSSPNCRSVDAAPPSSSVLIETSSSASVPLVINVGTPRTSSSIA